VRGRESGSGRGLRSRERAILVGIRGPRQSALEMEEHLEELARLTETAGGIVAGSYVQERARRDPATAVGRGKVEEILEGKRTLEAGLVIFDEDLTPAQVRNLEKALEVTVVDRSGLILDIFARRARSREAKVQVELAQLRYLLPRLARRWTHLERQAGGIGVRGVGETQLETDRRLIQQRIAHLVRDLKGIEQERSERRKRRKEATKVALVGYTNAGKSTLLNRLTGSEGLVEDRLFATLDPLVRQGTKEWGRFVFIDTVGFIRKLPPQLVASFRSTLEEAREADLLLHLIDLSHRGHEDQMRTTRRILEELRLDERPVLTAFNKVDRLQEPGDRLRAEALVPGSVCISAVTGEGLEELRKALEEAADEETVLREAMLPPGAGSVIARIHSLARVLASRMVDGKLEIRYRAKREDAGVLSRLIREAGGQQT
jgi:GTP-binding protein HflX